MSTHEHHDPFAPIDSADLPGSSDAAGAMPTAPHVPHHLLGALAPIDENNPFADGSAVVGANVFGVQAFDHASALNDNPFSDAAAVDDRIPANPSGNPLATLASPADDAFGE